MYKRVLNISVILNKSFFLFGPRGTGKTAWVKSQFPKGLYLDLLKTDLYVDLLSRPDRLESLIIPGFKDWIIIDEVQKIPQLLNEVHRLIENNHYKFILTGSSARSLRKKGVNLLAGRSLTFAMHPLTIAELNKDFNIIKSLNFGHLPAVFSDIDPKYYLDSYINTYLREEVLQEGLTRNLSNFSRFLEIASFSQGSIVNISNIAREVSVNRKLVENYFNILEDLLLSFMLPVFTKHAKRRILSHPKFYFFDVGVYRAIRPKGPLDVIEEIDGAALETLFIQEIRAINDYYQLGYKYYYWRTTDGLEVDFVLYGEKQLLAFEIKRSNTVKKRDLKSLQEFKKDYPEAKCYLLYSGKNKEYHDAIEVIPIAEALINLLQLLSN